MVSKELVRELVGDYSADGFVRILKQACAPASFVSVKKEYSFNEVGDAKVGLLGVVKDLPGDDSGGRGATALPCAPLLVADVPLATTLTERSSRIRQFKLAKKVLEHFAATPPMELDGVLSQGIFVFHDANGNFRVSLVTATPEKGKFNWSKARRQSFYVTADPDANATFVQRMCMDWSSLKGIKDAFSVEKLTKEFYNQLFAWYERACDDRRVEYPNGLDTDADNREDKNRKHLIRLITRLMFVWFLKQKKLVPDSLFDEAELKRILKDFNPVGRKQHQYYRAILQNLFFATLNSEIDERGFATAPTARKTDGKPMTPHHGVKTKYRYADEFVIPRKEVLDLFRPIPFLNGGLFECLDLENADGKVMYYDGFSQQERHRDLGTLTWAHVPNDLFFDPDYGIIPLLKRYNFTVEENSPGDEDVALDPELLGKVFENLLGAFNPETQEIARNATGSFYTPREIVNYMVDESLIAHLTSAVGGRGATALPGNGRARTPAAPNSDELTIRALVVDGVRPSDEALCKRLVEAIETAKILDPACGSGAFPMGALLKMVELLRILKKLPEDANLYDLKLKLIENCIFGSDIQEIAVQISKLRIFISLVCEQKPDMTKPNYGINTLPNLETKFVAANSLIALKREPQGELFYEMGEVKKTKDALWDVRHKHFLAKTRREKNELRKQDKALREKLAAAAKRTGYSEESTRLMASWDPYNQNVHAEFFDPEWMFNVKDGFDIVIGNPPYVEAKKLKDIVAPFRDKYVCASGTADLSVYFYERGLNLATGGGLLAYICTNKFFITEYGAKLRKFLREHDLRQVLDFEQCEVFESALVSSAITIAGNCVSNARNEIGFRRFKNLNHHEFIDAFRVEKSNLEAYPLSVLTESEWSFSDVNKLVLKERIEHGNKRIGEIPTLHVYRGVTTGFNPAFIIDESKRSELIGQDSKSALLIKDMLQGRNIRKWFYNDSFEYLIFTRRGTDIEKFTSVKMHLKQYYADLKPRSVKSSSGRKPGNYQWFEILDNTAYYKHFEAIEKVIWGLTADKWAFAYDDRQHYLPSNGYILTSDDLPVKYVLGLLNSKLLHFYFGFIGVMTAGGAYTLKAATIEALPIPNASPSQQKAIIALVDRILVAKKRNPAADTSALEREIDEKVYRLYGLTDDEIRVIEGKDKEGEGGSVNERDARCPSGGGVNGRDARCPGVVTKKRKPKIVEEF